MTVELTPQRPVIVLGSHRSGTSAVMGALVACGLAVGEVLPPQPDNPKGFFEPVCVVETNRRLLQSMGRDWTCPPRSLHPSSWRGLDLDAVCAEVRGDARRWGFKDPRTLFTLPAWATVLDEAVFIGVHRDTSAVARSLTRRDGFTEEAAAAIAGAYTGRLADLHRQLGFPILPFGADVVLLKEKVRRIVEALGLDWDAAAVDDYIDGGLIRESSDTPVAEDDVYLAQQSRSDVTPFPTSAQTLQRALHTVESRVMDLPWTVGPTHQLRRRQSWDRLRVIRPDIGGPIELITKDSRLVPLGDMPPDTTIMAFGDDEGSMVELQVADATHILAPAALDAISTHGLLELLSRLDPVTDSSAVIALNGLVLEGGDLPAEVYIPEEDRTYFRTRFPHVHHRDAIEGALLGTGWHLAGIERERDHGQRSSVFLSRSASVRLDDHVTQQESREARAKRLLQLDAAIDELDATKEKLDATRQRASALSRSLKSANRNLGATASRLDLTRKLLRDTERALRSAERTLGNRTERLKLSRQKVEGLRADVARLNTELAKARAKQASLRRELQHTRQQYDRLRHRRSVRWVLRLSAVAKPLFSMMRRREGASRQEAAREKPPSAPVTALTPGRPASDASREEQTSETQHESEGEPAPHVGAAMSRLEGGSTPPRAPMRPTIIVPVFNALDELKRCLDSIVTHTQYPADLLIIDDASTDPEVIPYLEQFAAGHDSVKLLRNERNVGFTATVNRGFAETSHDVVIVNSDVVVPPGWLRRLCSVAQSQPRAATVTPLSDNAGAFSAPVPGQRTSLPPSLTPAEIGRLVARTSGRVTPHAPTGHGFCMLIRRAAIDELGGFDAEAFPRGYGEENDFCMRALERGWLNLVDDSTYVLHARSASFGDEKHHLMSAGRAKIDGRHPQYGSLVREFLSSAGMKAAQTSIAQVFDKASTDPPNPPLPRVLYVIHKSGGGTPGTNLDLARAISSRFEPLLLQSDTRQLTLLRLVDGDWSPVQEWVLERRILPTDLTLPDYASIVDEILVRWDIDVVHVRHLIAHTFDVPRLAKNRGIPVVLSIHDYYYACPTVHLLDESDRYCAGECTPGQGVCRLPTPWLAENLPHLKHAWVYEWRQRVRSMLTYVDVLIAASEAARQVYLSAYPELSDRDFRVLPHGRDLVQVASEAALPVDGTPVRILVPGNIDVHKGANHIAAIKALDEGNRLEFHVLGLLRPDNGSVAILHGAYRREEFASRTVAIGPSFVGVFSRTAETYSHVLNEAWSMGIPVLVTDRGAPAERVRARGGGWVIDADDAHLAYEQILSIIDDPEDYARTAAEATLEGERNTSEMAADYEELYRTVMAAASPFVRRPHKPPRVGLFVVGSGRSFAGSTYVRVLQRYFHPSVADFLVPQILEVDRFIDHPELAEIDVAVVQRTAVAPEWTAEFLNTLEDRGVRLIFEIDDDLLHLHARHPERQALLPWNDSLIETIRSADTVTVSTEPLREVIVPYNGNVEVLANLLDERLWFSSSPPACGVGDGTIRVLYYGTVSHIHDLEMIRPAWEELRRSRPIELWVAGVDAEDDWFNILDIPTDATEYPAFVSWLRGVAPRFDFGIAPLTDNDFNRRKSDLKALELAALGLPAICSDLEPYRGTVIHGQTGLLAGSVHEWREAMSQMCADADLRRRLAINAHRRVIRERGLQQGAAHLRRLFEA